MVSWGRCRGSRDCQVELPSHNQLLLAAAPTLRSGTPQSQALDTPALYVMNPSRVRYIQLAVRGISIVLAFIGISSACLMVWALSAELANYPAIERIAVISIIITLPVLYVASAILILREWSRRAIQLFSLLFALAVSSLVGGMLQPLRDSKGLNDYPMPPGIWAFGLLIVLIAIYGATQKVLVSTTVQNRN